MSLVLENEYIYIDHTEPVQLLRTNWITFELEFDKVLLIAGDECVGIYSLVV